MYTYLTTLPVHVYATLGFAELLYKMPAIDKVTFHWRLTGKNIVPPHIKVVPELKLGLLLEHQGK